MDKIWSWGFHDVYSGNWNYVRKFPNKTNKSPLTFQQAATSLAIHQQLFWDFCPPTKVVDTENGYCIIQKKINWRLICEIPQKEIENKTLEDLTAFVKALSNSLLQWRIPDYYWIQAEPFEWKISWRNTLTRLVEKIKLLPGLWIFYKNIFKSSNLMVADDWKIYLIDNVDNQIANINPKIWPGILIRHALTANYILDIYIKLRWKNKNP